MTTLLGGGRDGFDGTSGPPPLCVVEHARDYFRDDGHVVGDQCVAVMYEPVDDFPRIYRCDLPAKGALDRARALLRRAPSRWETVVLTVPVCGKHGRAKYVRIEENRVRLATEIRDVEVAL